MALHQLIRGNKPAMIYCGCGTTWATYFFSPLSSANPYRLACPDALSKHRCIVLSPKILQVMQRWQDQCEKRSICETITLMARRRMHHPFLKSSEEPLYAFYGQML